MRTRLPLAIFGRLPTIALIGFSALAGLAALLPGVAFAATAPAHQGPPAPAQHKAHHAAPGPVVVEVDNAWVSQPAPGTHVTAAYFTMSNMGHGAAILTAVTCPLAQHTTLEHTLLVQSGSAPVLIKRVTVPPSQILALAPDGVHVRLDGLTQRLRIGEYVPLVLHFAGGSQIQVSAQVRPYAGE